MMQGRPLVSVVIPFRDPPSAFFQEAIESVLAQSYTDWELLLVDDGSGAESATVAWRYADANPGKVRRLEHPGGQNRGPHASRDLGIAHARGDLLAFLDADDVWLPRKLEEHVPLMARHPTAGMLYGSSLYWFSWTGRASDLSRDYVPELGVPADTLIQPPELLRLFLTGAAAVPCPCSVLARSAVVRRLGGFEASFRGTYEDQVFYAKMCLHAPVFVSGGCSDRYRQHRGSATALVKATVEERADRESFLGWLAGYLTETGIQEHSLWRVLRSERWKLRHPRRARLLRGGSRLVRRIAAAWRGRRPRSPVPARVRGDRRIQPEREGAREPGPTGSRQSVAVVMLTANQREKTLACLATVRAQEGAPYRVLLWDNGSRDGTADAVRAALPDVLVHQHPSNLGVASGRNAAAALAIERLGPSHLLFLDNDMSLWPGFIRELLQPFAADPLLAQTQAKLRYADDPERLNDGGGHRVHFWLGRTTPVCYKEIDRGQCDRPAPSLPCGGAMMVRADIFQELGGFDAAFDPFGPEDLDFSLRVREAGYRALYVPTAVAYHQVSHTFGAGYTEGYAQLKVQHWIQLLRRHAPPLQQLGFFLVGGPYVGVQMIVRELRRGNAGAARGALRGAMRSAVDLCRSAMRARP